MTNLDQIGSAWSLFFFLCLLVTAQMPRSISKDSNTMCSMGAYKPPETCRKLTLQLWEVKRSLAVFNYLICVWSGAHHHHHQVETLGYLPIEMDHVLRFQPPFRRHAVLLRPAKVLPM